MPSIPELREVHRLVLEKLQLLHPDADTGTDADILLYGENGMLSSIELVMLIVETEQALRAQTGLALVLASSRAMSSRNSPFRSVNSFSNYIFEELSLLNKPNP